MCSPCFSDERYTSAQIASVLEQTDKQNAQLITELAKQVQFLCYLLYLRQLCSSVTVWSYKSNLKN